MHGTLTAPSGEIIDHNERRWHSRAAAHIAGAQWAKRWPRLSEQIFRIDKWSVCRGVKLPSGEAAA